MTSHSDPAAAVYSSLVRERTGRKFFSGGGKTHLTKFQRIADAARELCESPATYITRTFALYEPPECRRRWGTEYATPNIIASQEAKDRFLKDRNARAYHSPETLLNGLRGRIFEQERLIQELVSECFGEATREDVASILAEEGELDPVWAIGERVSFCVVGADLAETSQVSHRYHFDKPFRQAFIVAKVQAKMKYKQHKNEGAGCKE